MARELARVNDFNAVVDYSEMFASFAGDFADLRGVDPRPECLHRDPALGYPRRYIRDVAGSPRGLSIEVTKLTPVAPDP